MYGDILGGHILLVCNWIEVLFTLTILALKGFGSGEREQNSLSIGTTESLKFVNAA